MSFIIISTITISTIVAIYVACDSISTKDEVVGVTIMTAFWTALASLIFYLIFATNSNADLVEIETIEATDIKYIGEEEYLITNPNSTTQRYNPEPRNAEIVYTKDNPKVVHFKKESSSEIINWLFYRGQVSQVSKIYLKETEGD